MKPLPAAIDQPGPGEIWCDRYQMPVGLERCAQSAGRLGCGKCPDGLARRLGLPLNLMRGIGMTSRRKELAKAKK